MLPPIRCCTCNELVKFREFDEQLRNQVSQSEALSNIGANLYCCRRMYLGIQIGLTDILLTTECTGFEDELNKLEIGVSTDRVIHL